MLGGAGFSPPDCNRTLLSGYRSRELAIATANAVQ